MIDNCILGIMSIEWKLLIGANYVLFLDDIFILCGEYQVMMS